MSKSYNIGVQSKIPFFFFFFFFWGGGSSDVGQSRPSVLLRTHSSAWAGAMVFTLQDEFKKRGNRCALRCLCRAQQGPALPLSCSSGKRRSSSSAVVERRGICRGFALRSNIRKIST